MAMQNRNYTHEKNDHWLDPTVVNELQDDTEALV